MAYLQNSGKFDLYFLKESVLMVLRKSVLLALLCSAFIFNRCAFADDDPPKLVSLGLSAATAMASQKDVVTGLKQAAADEYTDWLWEAVGGTEKFMTGNAEAEIPAAKDKIMKIVNTVKAIENFAIAVTEGRYDDAAFTAIDEVVGALNHPLVSLTWEMAKLTYESHKLVVSTGAERDIEALYGIVARDRRMMGVVDPNADEPAQIPVDASTADYFFDKYIVTDGSARGLLKSYVTTHLGEEWPEESWSDYMSSWMAVGSGVDTAEKAEINMLAGEWRNKARGWIVQLLKEANKQAKVAWGEARLRQQLAEFEKFSERVGHFYNNDLDRMIREFLAIKANRAAEAELALLPAASKKAIDELTPKVNKMSNEDLKDAPRWEMQINEWQLKCLSGSSKMIAVNDGLSKTLSDERKKWLSLADVLNKKVKELKGQVFEGVVEETFVEREYGSSLYDQTKKGRDAANEARAKQFYEEYFKSVLVELDWLTIRKDVELKTADGKTESVALIADPDTAVDEMTNRLNVGDFQGADIILEFWKNDASSGIFKYLRELEGKVKTILSVAPDSLTSAKENLDKANAEYDKFSAQMNARRADVSQRRDAVIKKYSGFYGVNWGKVESDGEYQSLTRTLQDLNTEQSKFYRATVQPASEKYNVERNGWDIVAGMARNVLKRMTEIESMLHDKVVGDLTAVLEAYRGLRAAQQANYEKYVAQLSAILADLPTAVQVEVWGAKDELAMVEDEAYTMMGKLGAPEDPVRARDMVNFLSKLVPAEGTGYLAERLIERAADIEAKARVWDKAEKQFSEIPPLDNDDVNQIRVLVKPDFDQDVLREKIKEGIANAKELKAIPDRFKAAAKKAATDLQNRETDRDFLQNNLRILSEYFSGLHEQGLIDWGGNQDYKIAFPNIGRDGMVKLETPFAHYATRAELTKMAQPVRDAWSRMKAASFAKKNAPDHVAKWEQIMNAQDVPVAKGENFIAPNYDLPIYKEDLDQALALVKKIKGSSDAYRETMEQVAALVPGLMQVPTVIEKENDAKMAALYKMDLQEYLEKYTKRSRPVVNYLLTEQAKYMIQAPDSQHELGKMYVEIARRVEELHIEALDYAAEQARKEAEAQARAYQEERQKKIDEEARKAVDNMGAAELAGFYGYYLQNPRINSRSVSNMRGDVVLSKSDLISGEIILEGRLFTIDKAKTMLLSEDGGRTWQELALNQDINYRFQPMPNKAYDFILRVKTTDERETQIRLFPEINSIIYQDVDFEQLIAQTVKEIADAYEMMNASVFSDFISRDYLGNKAILEEGVRFDFDMFMNIRLTIYINRIQKRGNMFVAETKWDKSQTPRKTGEEQKTSGKTTFMFVLEDGKMKIQNLRGDLIYATLSPEIAQASGKSQTVVNQILTARDDRNPIQPGAGDTEDDGGLTDGDDDSGGLLTVKTRTFTVGGWGSSPYIDFDNGNFGVGELGDVFFAGMEMNSTGGVATIYSLGLGGEALFNSLDEVPGGFSDNTGGFSHMAAVGGDVYVILTGDGNYVKMVVSSVDSHEDPPGFTVPDAFTIKYAISDGSTNLATQ